MSKIIFLNGVTSSGKTSIAKAIQKMATEHFYHISNDMFHNLQWEMACPQHAKHEDTRSFVENAHTAESIVFMYHHASTSASYGKNIIVDGMLFETAAFVEQFGKTSCEMLRHIFAEQSIFMVEVFCPLAECKRRNILRGDRHENQSHKQDMIMNKTVKYDFRVDTSVDSTETCAKKS